MNEPAEIVFPAEWHNQSGVMVTWPHQDTDWSGMLEEVEECFENISNEISKREKLVIVCRNKEDLLNRIKFLYPGNILFAEIPSNDTWARDHGPVSVYIKGKPAVFDFTFNGWGMKFEAGLDNQITEKMYSLGFFKREVGYEDKRHFILEGGSIESDGNGTLMTTCECLCSKNRNSHLKKEEIETYLKEIFNLKQVLWISSGYLEGDDTDSHIDTLARFCNETTIAYVRCDDPADEHYKALSGMEEQLRSFRTLNNEPYNLAALPMADPVYDGNQRLPATYANFLIINNAVLVPFYHTPKDETAKMQLQKVFPDREIIGINCLPLIKQHGSLHCVTMQFPEGFI